MSYTLSAITYIIVYLCIYYIIVVDVATDTDIYEHIYMNYDSTEEMEIPFINIFTKKNINYY